MPDHATPTPRAKDVPMHCDAWAYLINGRIVSISANRNMLGQLPWMPDTHGHRIAHVRITEIQQEATNAQG